MRTALNQEYQVLLDITQNLPVRKQESSWANKQMGWAPPTRDKSRLPDKSWRILG